MSKDLNEEKIKEIEKEIHDAEKKLEEAKKKLIMATDGDEKQIEEITNKDSFKSDDLKKKKKIKIKNIVIIVELLFFVVVVFGLVIGNLTQIFDAMMYLLIDGMHTPDLNKFFVIITKLGNVVPIAAVVALSVAIFRNKYSLLLCSTTVMAGVSNFIIKRIVRRDRPDVKTLIEQGGYSFPSGHAMIMVAVYGSLIYIVSKNVKNKILKSVLMTIFAVLIVLVSFSRIYVGVHYTSDVLAGISLSLVELLLLIDYFEKKHLGE